jgi:hypothetical protein
LTHTIVPKSLRAILLDLENLKKVFAERSNEAARANKAKVAAAAKSAGVPRKGKRAHGGGPDKGNPKMGRTDKFCKWCKGVSVHLTPDLVEYEAGATAPLYDLIIGKQTLHDIGAILDFKEKTITIDNILLPMRNITNLQLKPSVTRALRHNTCQAQEPVSTQNATKRVIEILDAKYDKANLPAIVRDNCSHLTPLQREKLLSLLLDFESLFDGTLGDWNRPPVSIELKEGAKPYHGRP